jgi:hypothetical protein
MVDYKILDEANFYINIVSICITLPLASLLLIKFRFKLDKSAIFILLVYLVANFSRLFAKSANYSFFDMINPICSSMVWCTLMHFVLEMRHIQTLLTSQSHLEFKSKVKSIKITMFIMQGNLVLVYFPTNLTIFLGRETLKHQYYEVLTWVVLIRAVSLFIFCMYLFSAFIDNFVFFVRKKAERNYSKMRRYFDSFGFFMLYWTVFLWIIKLTYGLASIFLVSIERLGDNVEQNLPRLFFLYYFSMRTYSYIVDFLFTVTLIYLFYSQAKLAQ